MGGFAIRVMPGKSIDLPTKLGPGAAGRYWTCSAAPVREADIAVVSAGREPGSDYGRYAHGGAAVVDAGTSVKGGQMVEMWIPR